MLQSRVVLEQTLNHSPWNPPILVISEVSVSPDTEAGRTEAQSVPQSPARDRAPRRQSLSVSTECGITVATLP